MDKMETKISEELLLEKIFQRGEKLKTFLGEELNIKIPKK